MRRLLIAALLVILSSTSITKAQQSTPQVQTPTPDPPRRVGGAVLPPTLIKSVEPKYPSNNFARPANGKTTVVVSLVVNRKGHPTEIHINRSGGDIFDKSAIDAVSRYLFKPATENGQPVPVKIDVVVRFQIMDK